MHALQHIFAVLIAVTLPLLVSCKPKAAAAVPPAPVEVQTARPLQRDEPIYAEWVGTLDGFVNAQVRAQVTGDLLRQRYTEGAPVKAGDLLFEIDPRPFQAIVDQAAANAEKAEADFKRNAELADEQAVARQDYDNASSALAAAKAALAQARLNVEFTQIRSPIDGVAGIAEAQIGDLVGPATGVMTTVSTLDPIKAYFSISEQAFLEFQRRSSDGDKRFLDAMELELILSDGSVYSQPGKFFAADRQIDPNTGTIRIAGTFPNAEFILRPGKYARIRSVVRVAKNALEVPQRAVTELQGGYQVAVVGADNVAHLRPVKVDRRVGSNWIIAEGLKPDDQVVVEGLQKVKEGATVSAKAFVVAAAPTAAVSQ